MKERLLTNQQFQNRHTPTLVKQPDAIHTSVFVSVFVLVALLIMTLWPVVVTAATEKEQPAPELLPVSVESAEARWEFLRQHLFQDQSIEEDSGIIILQAPGRAMDSARVPVTLTATIPQDDTRYIERLYLIVDKNPVPVAATFTFQPNNGWATINTEVRINEYSHIRAIAQTNDNELHMTTSFIKASGGCSAPPSSYERSESSLLGRIEMNVDSFLKPEVPAVARFRLTHPNSSGMQFDQFTRTYIPAHYIHTMGATFNNEEVFSLETNFSLSQDPMLGFNFVPDQDGELKIFAIDSENQRYEKTWSITAK